MSVPLISILASLLFLMGAYLYVSIRERSYINVMTPAFAVFIPSNYLLELFHLSTFGPSGSSYAYILSYGSYAAHFVSWALGYTLRVRPLRLPFASATANGSTLGPYFFMLAAVALYWPVLNEHRDLWANPRQIYEQTRSGYGLNFFFSAALCYLSLALLFFKKSLTPKELIGFVLFAMGFMWMHGSKHHMITIMFMVTMYWVYARNWKVSLFSFLLFVISFVVLGIGLFLITTPDLVVGRGVTAISEYSEYTRNGMLVIDSNIGPLYGKLSLELELYSRIPRILFPDKPNDFGMFYLAKYFYPDNFAKDTGAPDFGYGVLFADFGVATPLIMLVTGLASGVMLKTFIMGLRKYRGPGDFILVLFAVGLSLIPIGGVFLLPESICFAILANMLHSMRLVPRTGATRPGTA